MDLAVLGLGTMGRPIATTLAGRGHTVTTWSRSGHDVRGIRAVGDAASAVRGAEVVLLSLADDVAVLEVLGGVVEQRALGESTLIVDTSTIAPSTATAAHALVGTSGAAYIDAPVSGGPAGAAAGRLTIMVGGSVHAVQRASGVLEALGDCVLHAGPAGSGQALKLCCQSAVAIQMNMIAQLAKVAEHHAIPLELLQWTVLGLVESGSGR
jgi:3-hydroxyisobutyrate dehydrogenase